MTIWLLVVLAPGGCFGAYWFVYVKPIHDRIDANFREIDRNFERIRKNNETLEKLAG